MMRKVLLKLDGEIKNPV
jgi:hypothetical protein